MPQSYAYATAYKYRVEGVYNMSITIDIFKLGLINFSRLVIEITEANLRPFQYVYIN